MKQVLLGISFVILVFTTPFMIVACDDPATVSATNKVNLSGDGEEIGTLKDGRKVVRFAVERPNDHTHYVYVVSDGSSVTENHLEGGKHKTNKATVVIDGKEYIEKPLVEKP